MRLFPTVHATGDLAPAQRAHLELHGLAFVAADDDPDLVLVLPGTTPAGDTTRTGVVVLATGSETPEVARLLASRGITVHASSAPASGLVPADLTADDLLAWTTDVVLPVHATLDVEGPAAPLLRTATGSQALGLTVGAGVRDEHGRLLVLGVDALADAGGAAQRGDLGGAPRRCRHRRRSSRRARVAPGVEPAEAGRHRAPGPAGQGRVRPGRRAAPPRPRAGARDRPVRRRARAGAAARRGLPDGGRQGPDALVRRRASGSRTSSTRSSRSTRSASASTGCRTWWSSRCTRRTAAPTGASRPSCCRCAGPTSSRTSRPTQFSNALFVPGHVPRLHARLRHQLRGALPGDRRRARGADVHLGRDLRRPRGRPVPPRRPRRRRHHPAGAAPRRRAAAGRPAARRGDVRPVGPGPRPHPHARRPAVRPVHDQAADAVLPLLAGGAALRPDGVPRGRAARGRRRAARPVRAVRDPVRPHVPVPGDRHAGAQLRRPRRAAAVRLAAPAPRPALDGLPADDRLAAGARRGDRARRADRAALLALDRPAEDRALARRVRAGVRHA